jgi:acetoin utilization protein AcuB
MSKSIPTLMKYMTTTPHSIGADQPLAEASSMMKKYQIRHLPVLKAGQLCGILSDRDLKMALGITGVDAEKTTVQEIAFEDPYLVHPETKLNEVIKTMAEKRIGSALVMDHHKLVGIFTTTDALRAFEELLETRLTH